MDTAYLAQLPADDANLIIQLLEEDGQQLIYEAEGKGKLPEDTMTDAQLAADLLMNQLEMASTFLADVRMAKSLQDAVEDDEQILADSRLDERIAENDRALCVALSNGEYDEPPLGLQILPEEKDDFFDKLSCIYITGLGNILDEDFEPEADFATSVDSQPESSSRAARRRPQRAREFEPRPCEACSEVMHFALLAKAPCGHEYCRECFTKLFRTSMADETLFPPQCCQQPIPLDKSRLFLDPEIVPLFQEKAVEFSTANRIYCSNSDCAVFVPPKAYVGQSVVSCHRCSAQTCVACKGATHDGDCRETEQLKQVLQVARDHGWQRCQNCWGMVELNTGCFHMT